MNVRGPDGLIHQFPEGTTAAQISAAFAGESKQNGFTPDIFKGSPFTAPLANEAIRKALPAAGAITGSVVGSPFGLPGMVYGAAAGGAAGEGARQAFSGEKIDPMAVAHEGAGQGLLEAGGQALVGPAAFLGRSIMRGAVRASPSIQYQFPGYLEEIQKGGWLATKKGAAGAEAARAASGQNTKGLLQGAENSGTMFNSGPVTQPVNDLLGQYSLENSKKAVITKELQDWLAQYGGDITPTQLQELKQVAQKNAAPTFSMTNEGVKPEALNASQQFWAALRRGAHDQLDLVPGVSASDARTQALMGAEDALQAAASRHATPPNILNPSTWLPFGRQTASFTARMISHPGFQQLIKQSPRLAAELLTQSLNSSAPADATSGR